MVDINLLGKDKASPPRDNDETDFTSTYSTDTQELTSEPGVAPGGDDFSGAYFDKSYTRGSRKLLYFLVGGCVVLVFVLLFLLTGWGPEKAKKKPAVEEIKPLTNKSKSSPLSSQPGAREKGVVPKQKPAVVDPLVREMFGLTQQGVRTVSTILSSAPPGVGFTMISYSSGGRFLMEILANSAASINEVAQKLNDRLPTSKVTILSRGRKTVGRRSFSQAIISGIISEGKPWANFNQVSQPNYLGKGEIEREVKKFCGQYGMTLRSMEVRDEVREARYRKSPIFLRATGNKDSALNFLEKLSEGKLNLSLTKILLFASDQQGISTPKVNLVLDMELYWPI